MRIEVDDPRTNPGQILVPTDFLITDVENKDRDTYDVAVRIVDPLMEKIIGAIVAAAENDNDTPEKLDQFARLVRAHFRDPAIDHVQTVLSKHTLTFVL
jgi:hypothetical protein